MTAGVSMIRHRRSVVGSRALAVPIVGMVMLLMLSLALTAALTTAAAAEKSGAFDPVTGYRIRQYRAPTPADVPGGTRVSLDELKALVRGSQVVLVDVMASEGAGLDAATGRWHTAVPRHHMAGSVWLPDVGRGVLTPALDQYFRDTLQRLTGGDVNRAIVIYCQADCWMSWNAVRRAAGYGYRALYWYPEGTDGMRDEDLPLVEAVPEPLSPRHPGR